MSSRERNFFGEKYQTLEGPMGPRGTELVEKEKSGALSAEEQVELGVWKEFPHELDTLARECATKEQSGTIDEKGARYLAIRRQANAEKREMSYEESREVGGLTHDLLKDRPIGAEK